MADETTSSTATTAGDAGSSTNAATEGNAETSAAKENEGAEKTFVQADVDRIVQQRLADQKKAHDKAVADAKAEADRKAAEEQGQFKPLYEAEQQKVEALNGEVTSLRELANRQVDAAIESWPDEFKAMIPDAETASPLDRLQAVERTKPAVALVQTTRPTPPNLDATAGGRGSGMPPEEARRSQASLYR